MLPAALPVLQQSEAVATFAIIRARRRYADLRAQHAFHQLAEIVQLCESERAIIKYKKGKATTVPARIDARSTANTWNNMDNSIWIVGR